MKGICNFPAYLMDGNRVNGLQCLGFGQASCLKESKLHGLNSASCGQWSVSPMGKLVARDASVVRGVERKS